MQELGMIVDCSHLNDVGTEQLGDILDVPLLHLILMRESDSSSSGTCRTT